MRLEIPAPIMANVYAHARQTYPEECCGFLIGPAGGNTIDEARPVSNRQDELHRADPAAFPRTAHTAYNIGPADLLFLEKSLRGARPVRIIYHSHCDVGAYFSDEDARAATWEGELLYPVDYLVVDATAQGPRGAKLFRFDPGIRQFLEIGVFLAS